MKREQIEKIIKQLIIINKAKVISALKFSGVNISDNINDKGIYETVLSELDNGNQKLIINLGLLIDYTFDDDKENKSNVTGFSLDANALAAAQEATNKETTWWQKNRGNVFSTGVDILGNMFGKNNSESTTPSAPQYSNTDVGAFLANQQKDSERRRQEDARRRDADKSRKNTNMVIFGVIGSAVLIGSIIAIVKFNK